MCQRKTIPNRKVRNCYHPFLMGKRRRAISPIFQNQLEPLFTFIFPSSITVEANFPQVCGSKTS